MLAERKAEVVEERSTRVPLTPAEVKALLAAVESVILVRGRAVAVRPAKRVRPADLRGPTGGFRAPMLRRDRTLLVGYSGEGLAALLG